MPSTAVVIGANQNDFKIQLLLLYYGIFRRFNFKLSRILQNCCYHICVFTEANNILHTHDSQQGGAEPKIDSGYKYNTKREVFVSNQKLNRRMKYRVEKITLCHCMDFREHLTHNSRGACHTLSPVPMTSYICYNIATMQCCALYFGNMTSK